MIKKQNRLDRIVAEKLKRLKDGELEIERMSDSTSSAIELLNKELDRGKNKIRESKYDFRYGR